MNFGRFESKKYVVSFKEFKGKY